MLQLRPFRASDADVIVTWAKDEVAFRKWVADRYEKFPIKPEDMVALYNAMDPDRFFPMTTFDETGVVGHLILRFPNETRSEVRLGFIIVDDSKRGMGYGKHMIELAVEYGFKTLKAEKLTLGVFENNESAYRCYRAVGFRDVETDKTECYQVQGETWKCREMEKRHE